MKKLEDLKEINLILQYKFTLKQSIYLIDVLIY